jgi:energy-coupling factor transporter ATP-binding protein EcfA2
MADLRDLIDRFDRLVSVADGLVPDEVLESAARVGRRARDRRGFLGETVVVALAGGTGSGKSSLINALAGEIVAETGAQRPTTFEPLAWIPANPEPGLVRLLDSIGIDERVGQDRVPWLAVIDLPDTDSVSEENRATVERVLPLVDAVVWVVDPEKYQDRVLHERYLAPLARHADRFVFVVNHIDRVAPEDVPLLLADLEETLRTDGVGGAQILTTAADPPMGESVGIEEFIAAMRSLGDSKTVVERGLIADLEEAAVTLGRSAGVTDTSGTGFSRRWEGALSSASEALAADLLGAETLAEAGRIGSRTARLTASMRARSAPRATVAVSASPGGGTRTAIEIVDREIAELIETVGSAHAGALRAVRTGVEEQVRAAVVAAGSASSVDLGAPPAWWQTAGYLRPIGAVAAGGLAYWSANALELAGPIPLVAALVLAVVVWLAIGAFVSATGRRWGTTAVTRHREQLAGHAGRELDRRLGRPLRDALRVRASVGAALTEFELMRSGIGARSDH